jgi:hypothetical protein
VNEVWHARNGIVACGGARGASPSPKVTPYMIRIYAAFLQNQDVKAHYKDLDVSDRHIRYPSPKLMVAVVIVSFAKLAALIAGGRLLHRLSMPMVSIVKAVATVAAALLVVAGRYLYMNALRWRVAGNAADAED